VLYYGVKDAKDSFFEEQMNQLLDLIIAWLDRIETDQVHLKELIEHRLSYIEKQGDDYEVIIRAAAEVAS
jgi:hypothetical protein